MWKVTRRFFFAFAISAAVFSSAIVFSQTTLPANRSLPLHEFPVTMSKKIVAGQTPVGTKVEARLAIATLMNGKVIPEDAVFTGEVVASAAKSAAEPSRLAIRVDSVQWKNGSTPVKAYLTEWYYPIRIPTSLGPDAPSNDSIGGSIGMSRGGAPRPSPPAPSSPFPGQSGSTDPRDSPSSTSSNISENRVTMKDVEATAQPDGSVVLTSKRANIKLDKTTTYVLATTDEMPTSKAPSDK